ncbi:MAG TPA: TonB C-terminal domain-containing protein [Spirochaetota bacterium]|nr:TonB C-terminal domain-containing protein [Spirochaetota bacterium]
MLEGRVNNNINLLLCLIISFFLHLIVLTMLLLPDSHGFWSAAVPEKNKNFISGRDIIVNINQNDIRDIKESTLLSDRDSTARGYITKEKGDRWLNNSLEFRLKSGGNSSVNKSAVTSGGEKTSTSDNGDIAFKYSQSSGAKGNGFGGNKADSMAIPDRNNITMKNAIFYSNAGEFSFNTAKFKNFEYFKNMKDKIASNWYPPLLANVSLGGYAPGNMRIMAIPSQRVKIAFIMNRNGDVLRVELVDSLGNKPLDDSCIDAIKLSRNFGKVPDDIKGELILIPFIFGYYSR